MEENKEMNEKNAIPTEILEYLKKKIEEEKREEEKKEREEMMKKLKYYIPGLVSIPEKYSVKNINAIVKFLKDCEFKPREERPSFKFDLKKNATMWLLLGAIIIVGIVGVIF